MFINLPQLTGNQTYRCTAGVLINGEISTRCDFATKGTQDQAEAKRFVKNNKKTYDITIEIVSGNSSTLVYTKER